jgi:hypothetical protein
MISKEELSKFRKLVEAFTDFDNQEFAYVDNFASTNSNITDVCTALVDQPTHTDEEEAEVCYVLLMALSSLVILTTSRLITQTITRSKSVLHKLRPSLRKAQIYTYLYCFEPEQEYKDAARSIIDSLTSKLEKSPEEERLIKNYKMIME